MEHISTAFSMPRAGDVLEIPMTEAKRENEHKGTASVIPPIPDWARPPAIAPNPDPKRLRWDADKSAFRLIHPPTRCTCGGAKSTLTGEQLTGGSCDGRATPPARFRPSPVYDPCRYCGTTGQGRVCPRCRAIKARLVTSGIAAADQILLAIHQALNAAEREGRRREDIAETKARRESSRRRRERRWVKDAPDLDHKDAPVAIAAAPAP